MPLSITKASFMRVGLAIGLPLSFFLIPITDAYTYELRIFFAITLFCMLCVAFEFFDTIIPAILLPTMYLLSGIAPSEVAFGAWTSNTIWMMLGAMILANALEECGLLARIAYWCVLKCGASYTGVLYGVFIAGTIINFITFCQAFIVMMVLGYGIIVALKLKASRESALLCFAIMLGGQGAPSSFLYNPGFLALAEEGVRQVIPGFTAVWYEMLFYNGIIFFFFLSLLWGFSRVFKAKDVILEGGKEYFEKAYAELGPLSSKEKISIAVVVILMSYLFTVPWHGYPAAFGFMTLPYILFLPVLKVGTAKALSKTNFGIFFFMVSCLGIGTVGGELGFGNIISSSITPLLEGAPVLLSLLIMMTCGAAANFFMTPYAMMAGLSYPFAQVGVDLGLNPMAAIMTLVASCDLILFPFQVAPYLLLYGYGMITMREFVSFNIIKILLTVAFFSCVMYPIWNFFGLLYAS